MTTTEPNTESESGTTLAPSNRFVSMAECAAWRDRARDGDAITQIATESGWARKTVLKHIHGNGSCNHPTESETDVAPAPDANDFARCGVSRPPNRELTADVAGALAHELARNIGNTVYVNPRTIKNRVSVDVATNRIGTTLSHLANDETQGQATARAFGLTISQTNPGANVPRWAVRRFEEGDRS